MAIFTFTPAKPILIPLNNILKLTLYSPFWRIRKVSIGTTRYTNAVPTHRRLETGYTWYTQTGRKIYANSECKLLLLTHAFEELKAIAVGFRANRYNFQLRNAILRLGAKQDGILRNHQILPGGLLRDTVIFSIIDSEWEACKHSLLKKIEHIHKKDGN